MKTETLLSALYKLDHGRDSVGNLPRRRARQAARIKRRLRKKIRQHREAYHK